MGQTVIKVSKHTLNKMLDFYKEQLEASPPGGLFRARTDYAVITAYKSGKVMFQGSNIQEEVRLWQNDENKTNKTKTSKLPSHLLTHTHIGSDESGTGDYFGPVTTCAVYLDKSHFNQLKTLGIQDSKLIKDEEILRLSKEIVKLEIPYSLLILHNEKYNQLQKKGWSQGKMKAMLHHYAIDNVRKKTNSNASIVIDQFCLPSVYKNYLASEDLEFHENTFFLTKAEQHSLAVATASVIARASFLNEMELLSQETGHTLLKGASHKVDLLIAKLIRDKGEAYLNKIAKFHFANTNKAKQLL